MELPIALQPDFSCPHSAFAIGDKYRDPMLVTADYGFKKVEHLARMEFLPLKYGPEVHPLWSVAPWA